MNSNNRSPIKRRAGTRKAEITYETLTKISCRQQQITTLRSLFGEPDHFTFSNVFIFGHSATGKTYVLRSLIQDCSVPHVWINCIVVYNQRLLFEAILSQLSNLILGEEQLQGSCENACEFLYQLTRIFKGRNENQRTIYLVLDKAEKLCDMPPTVLSVLLRIQEITGLNFCTILVSENSWDKFNLTPEPYILHFPEYSKDELLEILLQDCPENHSKGFYAGYLHLVLNICYTITRDLQELRYVALSYFDKYCEPVIKEEAAEEERHKLWKHIQPHLKSALCGLYLRESSVNSAFDSTKMVSASADRANVELPFYSKFLLLASYIASYNPQKADKQMFIKLSSKVRKKSIQQTKKRVIPQHERGPKVFPLHRMLSIFYSIIEEELKPTTFLLSQISTLVSLRLLSSVGSDLDFPKYKCIVTLDFIRSIGKTVSFDVMNYLTDFL